MEKVTKLSTTKLLLKHTQNYDTKNHIELSKNKFTL